MNSADQLRARIVERFPNAVKVGDWARSVTGEDGVVTLTKQDSAYILVRSEDRGARLKNFPMAELTKIVPPKDAEI